MDVSDEEWDEERDGRFIAPGAAVEEEEEGVVRLDDKHFQVKLCRACGWGWKEEEDSMQSFTLNKQVYGFPIERPLAQHTRAWAARRAPWAACRLRPQGL